MIHNGILMFAQGAALSLAVAGASFAQTTEAEAEAAAADAATPAEAPAPVITPLPGGASAITDVYGNWTVACAAEVEGPRCAVTQIQVDPQSGQRLLSAEMARGEDGAAEGIVLLPFGLALDRGAVLEIGESSEDLAYSTCFPGGCVIPVTLSAETLAAAPDAMNLATIIQDSGETLNFSIPLPGLTQALDRMAGIMGE
ncbi:MAG: invasion associated locus B family protein [Paracoccus sp. (in: a-proteobacteria)]|nr:invasion associated locus B family protein [Paracoccus sp. (in: a-proteobacteria)]